MFFKVDQKFNKKKKDMVKERYIILTDIYFLLFDPVKENKNFAKLLFWGDIKQLISLKGSSFSTDTITLDWRNEDNELLIQFHFSFPNISIKEFLDLTTKKILRIKEKFKIFQNDINKPNSEDDDNITNINMDKIILMIKFKEDLIEKKHSLNLVKELMNLYQKVNINFTYKFTF